jgi:RsiW-degrading membrane proteinase PrsW (M82 family)
MTAFGFSFSVWNVTIAVCSPLVYGFVCIRINRGVPSFLLLKGFATGFAASYIAYLIEIGFSIEGVVIERSHLFFGFLTLVAVPEEIVKLASLLGLTSNLERPRSAVLLLGCFIGCGFAASENVTYLQNFGSNVLFVRFFTATAFHAFNAILMARVLTASFISDSSLRILAALATAVLLHGAYDYFLTQSANDGGRYLFVLAFSVAAGYVSLQVHRMARS